ncbi:hypothetical protein E4U12_003065 [Claviceps purpurea]|nr:hypothetical protein E4U12_003065 [Claviceps purpurea]
MVRTSLVASLLAAAASSLAAKSVVPGAYIFELENGQQTMTGDGKTRMKLEYDLFTGLSVQLHDLKTAKQKVAKYAAMPAVKAVHPVTLYDMPNPKIEWIAQEGNNLEQSGLASRAEGGPDTYSTHVMTQVDKLRAKGITGKGIKVAVIDSDVSVHPRSRLSCLNTDGICIRLIIYILLWVGVITYGKDCLVSFGHDFVGDAYNGTNTPVPGEDPMDCRGHGSHVTGIIAAQNNTYGFTCTAPGVSLGAYRVFGCSGSGGNDVLIAAFNKAYQDGANIITASIGGSSGWAQDVWADAVSRIVDKGVPCVVSAGNEGDQGIFYANSPADGQHVSAIASFDNVQKPSILHLSKYQVDDGPEQSFGYVPSKLSNSWDGVNLPAWASSLDPTIKNDACIEQFYRLGPPWNLLFFSDKAHNAIDKGAKYVLFYNDAPGVAFEVKFDAPAPGAISAASMVDAETGETFIKALKGGKKLTLQMVGPKNAELRILTANNTMSGGAVSAFSSWGPTFDMRSKPQYSAIGGTVLSTFPRAKGSYAVPSGTSMACPQAAGIIALIRQVRGAITPQEIEYLLSSNSNPQLFNDGTKFYDYLAPIQQQGGDLV